MSGKTEKIRAMESPIERLKAVMAQLRDRENGCPWDLEQDFSTIAPYTVEEAYEVYDAIMRDDMNDLKEELGDVLFQLVFHAQMAVEKNLFSFDDVVNDVVDKMIFRHPHIFGDSDVADSSNVVKQWEELKEQEKQQKKKNNNSSDMNESILDNIPLALPALTRSLKLQKKAAKVGFDWPEIEQVLDKMEEEIAELRTEITKKDQQKMEEEFGDLLFNLVNFARRLDIDAEEAMRKANQKFEKRFRWLEAEITKEKPLSESNLEEMDALWNEAKKHLLKRG